MEEIKGYTVNEFPYKGLRKISDLISFEGPLLTHFKDQENNNILFYWVDYNEKFNRWLVFNVTEEDLYNYLKKKQSLKHLLDNNKFGFIFTVDIDDSLNYNNVHLVALKELSLLYQPEEDSFYKYAISDAYQYLEEIFSYNLHLENLREKALYLKISPNQADQRKYSGSIEAEDAVTFLKNVTTSYINYVSAEFTKKFKFKYSLDALPNVIKRLQSELRPRIVDLKFSSFSIAISPDNLMEENSGDSVLELWKDQVVKEYKEDVLDVDYYNNTEINRVIERFTFEERKKIFQPIFEIINNNNIIFSASEKTDTAFKKYASVSKEVTQKVLIDTTEKVKAVETARSVLAKIIPTKNKKSGQVLDIFENPKISQSWPISLIKGKDRDYEFTYAIQCLYEKQGDLIMLENEMLGIYAFGKTDQEAEDMFSEEFEFIYERYNSLPDEQLTDDVIFIRNFLNGLIKK